MKRLILIDAHAVIHRAYHALPLLTSPSGEPTNAVYGFTIILLRIFRELKPDYIAVAFDLPGPTFRHIAYERYKAQRPETPSDLSSQFSKAREVLDAFGIPVFEKEGYEADDIIGAIAKNVEKKKDTETVVVTGDLDMLQLVRPRLSVYSMKKGISETFVYDERAVQDRYGLKPSQLTDFKGLKGDPSDNIPGVKGIGEKTAAWLIKRFGSIEGVYKALKKKAKVIPERVAQNLREGEENAKFSKALATIETLVPIKFSLSGVSWQEQEDKGKIISVFQRLGFYSLIKRLGAEEQKKGIPVPLLSVSPPARSSTYQEFRTAADFRKLTKSLGETSVGAILDRGEIFLIPRGGNTVYLIRDGILGEDPVRGFFEKHAFFLHDAKALVHHLRRLGVEPGPIVFDTALASYLTGVAARDFSFPAVATRELGRLVSEDIRQEFGHFFDIVQALEVKLAEGRLRKIFEEIELPLVRILADMEERGVRVDQDFLRTLAKRIDKILERLTREIYKLAGEPFNINSPQKLSRILFEKLKIKTQGLRKTAKGGVISTGAAELEKLRETHPLVEKILSYRELIKLKTTYVDALPEAVDPQTLRLHTTFNQTGTATGRLSSANPNLQNIPVVTELGREIRKAFIAEKGFELASFDYSQIELRVAAHLANDKKMIEAFRKGLDIHKMTAAEIFNVPLEKVTPEQRRAAKTLNFGILYGMGSQALAESTGMSREEAKKFIDEYFRDFSGIRDYIEKTKRFVEESGYVETIFGRRRYIPEIHSPNWQLKREAERMAINMPVQGSATGDIIKLAMIKVAGWIQNEKLENDVRLLLQVHDELLFEIKESLVKKVAPRIKKLMEQVTEPKVPLVVDVKAGKNWGEQVAL